MKKLVSIIIFVTCTLCITNSLGKYVRDPVGLEFKHGIHQYLNWKWMLIDSLNTELDTIYIYGLHDNSIAGQDKTYNPRFMWSIILFSIYTWITWDEDKLYIILSCIMFGIWTSIFLILKNSKIVKKEEYGLIIIICGGLPFYLLLWWKVDDLQVSYFLFLIGHYFALQKNIRLHYLGHFFMLMAWGFYRFEFMVLYFLHGIIIGFTKKYSYVLWIIFAVWIIFSLNYQYKWELWISRDQFSYWSNLHQNEIKENLFKNEQIKLQKEYSDYTPQEFNVWIEADNNQTWFLWVAIRYFRLNKDWFEKRITHMKNLLFGLWYISFFILIWWVALIQKKKFKSNKEIYLLIFSLLGFMLLIYYSFYNPWEKIGEPRFIQSSYIRYSLGLIYIFWSVWIAKLTYKNKKILAMLVFTLCIWEPIRFISFSSSYPYYQTADKFKEAAITYNKQVLSEWKNKVVWIADEDVKQAVFLYNSNVLSYQAVPKNLLEEEINRIIYNGNEKNIWVIFSAMYDNKITEEMKKILTEKFSYPIKINWFNFYQAK